MNFVAVDFETANNLRTSACSVGLVKVENGIIIDELYTLLNPLSEFSYGNIRVHGIEPYMVDDAPTFVEFWPQFERFIEGQLLIAHNVTFDIGVLNACVAHAEVEFSPLNYTCSYRIAKKMWPNLASHRLSAVASYLGIPLIHHHALEDARAAALIAVKATHLADKDSIEQLAKYLQVNIK